jgi:hypothetical protein
MAVDKTHNMCYSKLLVISFYNLRPMAYLTSDVSISVHITDDPRMAQ